MMNSSEKPKLLKSQQLSSVLVLCPHPDDFDIAAVTLREIHTKGVQISVAVAPTYSGILESFYDTKVSEEEMIQTRENEQLNSVLLFGLNKYQIEFFTHAMDLDENGELSYSAGNKGIVGQALSARMPDAIFIPHPNDNNPAHSAMYKMVSECLREDGITTKLFKQMDPKTQGLQIDFYTPMSETDSEWKATLFECHKTQNHRNLEFRGISLADRVLESNKQIAIANELPCAMAEAFELELF